MKKVVIAVIVCMSLFLGACKDKMVSTTYTIGCLETQYGSVTASEWQSIEDYFSANVAFNKLVTFENKTASENDAEARAYCERQIVKLDTAYVCSLIAGTEIDYYIYGIETLNADGSSRYIKAIKFNKDGVVDVSE